MTTLSFDPDLFWTAKEIFTFPGKDVLMSELDEIKGLLEWCASKSTQPVSDAATFHNQAVNLDHLQIDFTGLFINGFPSSKAHPYAGWYLGEANVFGPSDAKMRDFYCRYGLEYDYAESIPADHIAVELEFVAFMLKQYHETGSEIYLTGLQEMMNQYMESWVFEFLQDMEVQARTDYYRYLARALTILLDQLKNQLKEVA